MHRRAATKLITGKFAGHLLPINARPCGGRQYDCDHILSNALLGWWSFRFLPLPPSRVRVPTGICQSTPCSTFTREGIIAIMRASGTSAFVVFITVSASRFCPWFHRRQKRRVFQLCNALLVSGEIMTIVVGGNGTNQDASLIFQPQQVKAAVGDTVVFNCTSAIVRSPPIFNAFIVLCTNLDRISSILPTVTNGTHSAIQSTFAEPCVPAHDINSTLN